jgi:hypothetical protein
MTRQRTLDIPPKPISSKGVSLSLCWSSGGSWYLDEHDVHDELESLWISSPSGHFLFLVKPDDIPVLKHFIKDRGKVICRI